jgi:hypothetical protein
MIIRVYEVIMYLMTSRADVSDVRCSLEQSCLLIHEFNV